MTTSVVRDLIRINNQIVERGEGETSGVIAEVKKIL